MRSALDRIYDAAGRRNRTMRFSEDVAVAKRALAYGYFRNDSERTIQAGEMVWLTDTGGVRPVELLEPPLASASMSYSWINPNGEVVRIYRE